MLTENVVWAKTYQNNFESLFGSFRGVYTTFLKVIFDFDFDPPVYRNVRKVSSGFEYFLLTFVPRLGLAF
jgi:hypothetical protein